MIPKTTPSIPKNGDESVPGKNAKKRKWKKDATNRREQKITKNLLFIFFNFRVSKGQTNSKETII